MPQPTFFILLLFSAGMCMNSTVSAQIPDSLRGRNDLQSVVHIGTNSSTANDVTPMFRFSMHYDSSRTVFLFGECKLNNSKIHFPTWHYDSTVNTLEANPLSNNSRTADITLVTGDTLSFYRELSWYNPIAYEQDEDGYYALDSLDYSIELVRSGTGSRLALLDSIGVLPRATPGYPDLHGTRPIIAHVKYAVPAGMNGETAYVRVKLYVRGNGPHYTIRHDEFTVNPSQRLADPLWLDYIDEYGGGLAKRTIQDLSNSTGSAINSSRLRVYPNPAAGEVQISYIVDDPTASTAIAVYDLQGRIVFIPSMGGNKPKGTNHTSYLFSSSGTFYVALISNGDLITTKKITVRR